jgi:hypothetical protein
VVLQDGEAGVLFAAHGAAQLRGTGVGGALVAHQRASPGKRLLAHFTAELLPRVGMGA